MRNDKFDGNQLLEDGNAEHVDKHQNLAGRADIAQLRFDLAAESLVDEIVDYPEIVHVKNLGKGYFLYRLGIRAPVKLLPEVLRGRDQHSFVRSNRLPPDVQLDIKHFLIVVQVDEPLLGVI